MSDVNIDPRVLALEEKRKAADVTVYAMRKRAGVSGSTFYAWFKGAEPKRSSLDRCIDAIDAIVKEREPAE